MLQRLRHFIARHQWGAVATEFVVLVVGVLLAFQIDRWGEERRDAALERDYLLRLHEDLSLEEQSLAEALDYAQARIAAVELLLTVMDDPGAAAESGARLPLAVETASWRSFPQLPAFVYQELNSTGRLSLIGDPSLRRDLAIHYNALQNEARVGTDRIVANDFDRSVYGVLTMDELVMVERGAWEDLEIDIAPERAREIADALSAREQPRAILPSLAQHHEYNIKVIERARERLRALIGQIDDSLAAGD